MKEEYITTLEQAINDFIDSGNLDYLNKTREYYKQLSIVEAIRQAANGLTIEKDSPVFHSHQFRIGKAKCLEGYRALAGFEVELIQAKNFKEIFTIIEEVKRQTSGLGDLWSYDTALRIGFNKGMLPQEVYVQSGVVKGAKKVLGLEKIQGRHLPLTKFQKELHVFPPYQLEFFLCRYGKG